MQVGLPLRLGGSALRANSGFRFVDPHLARNQTQRLVQFVNLTCRINETGRCVGRSKLWIVWT